MKKIVGRVIISLYVLIAVFVTSCLLSYNKYNVTEFGNKTLILINKDYDIYKKGDLIIAEETPNNNYQVGDKVFYYNTYESIVKIDYSFIKDKEKITEKETTFLLDKDYYISSEYIISNAQNCKQISYFGSILKIFESRWGYLFIFVLPILLAFGYEIYNIKKEVKNK